MILFDTKNPYRYLFPIGCLNGILGAILWVAFAQSWITFYPSRIHGQLMIGGFVFTYALGFLWTAIPRFLQSPTPSQKQVSTLFLLAILLPILGLLENSGLFYLLILCLLCLTIYFGFHSFKKRKGNPFPSFLFVFAALVLALLSALILFLATLIELAPPIVNLAHIYFLKGFVLFLYLGIGIKLVPVLNGWQPLPESAPNAFYLDRLYIAIIPALLIAFLLESLDLVSWAGPIYGIILCTLGLFRMNLGSIPKTKSALSFCVWISSICISLSPFLLAFFPSYSIHFWHLIFLSGLGLLILFVSLRVILAHSDQNFLLLERKPVFYVMGLLVLIAAITRASAPFMPKIILSHYSYAAIIWIVALLLWFFYFAKFTFFQMKNNPQ